MRIVRRYWDLQGQPERQVIVSRVNTYHGSTMAGASLGGMAFMRAGRAADRDRAHSAAMRYAEGGDEPPDEFGLRIARTLEQRSRDRARRVAAFIGEPIQGAGGVIIPPATYWPRSSASPTNTASCWSRTK